jgi:precorrin-2 dehydrogenase/sirohydrochlorin ferrochelatase
VRYFPVNLDVAGRKALVVGGGAVALRKVQSLVRCGANVTVVSPAFCAALRRMDGIRRVTRRYRKTDLAGACLVVSATDVQEVNRRVWEHATAARLPVNVVDQPDLCTFTVPAVLSRGDLLIAVSTGGGGPALSGRIRRLLAKTIGPSYGRQLGLLREMRPLVRTAGLSAGDRMRLMKQLAGARMHRTIVREGIAAARRSARAMLARAVKRSAAL